MKNEMIKFIDENFKVIKSQFLKDEIKNLKNECSEDDFELAIDLEYLHDQLEVSAAAELIDVINERSLGVDFEDFEDANELFDMIKAMKEAAN
jgi:protein-arginine kinase activator protein McsA